MRPQATDFTKGLIGSPPSFKMLVRHNVLHLLLYWPWIQILNNVPYMCFHQSHTPYMGRILPTTFRVIICSNFPAKKAYLDPKAHSFSAENSPPIRGRQYRCQLRCFGAVTRFFARASCDFFLKFSFQIPVASHIYFCKICISCLQPIELWFKVPFEQSLFQSAMLSNWVV